MLDPEDVETIAVVTGACLVAVVIGMVAKNSPPWWNIGLFFDWVVAAVAGGGAALVNNYAGTTKRFDSCVQMAANISMQTNNTVAPSRQVCGEQWNNNLGFPKSDDEMITDGELVVIGVLVSVGLFSGSLIYFTKVAVPLDQKPRGWSVWHDQHNAYLALALAAAITELVTSGMKHFAGVLRPSYYSLVSVTAASERQLRDAEWSYPSGHASFAFATMTVCFLYFVGKTETCKEGPGKAWKLILALFFPGIASMIAISRVVDYEHHPSDINAGAILGLCMGSLFYHQYFPSPWDARCMVPRLHPAIKPREDYSPI
eukprot:gene17493-2926_t